MCLSASVWIYTHVFVLLAFAFLYNDRNQKKNIHRHLCSLFHSAATKQLFVPHKEVLADDTHDSHKLTVHWSGWRRKASAARVRSVGPSAEASEQGTQTAWGRPKRKLCGD